MKVTYSLFKNSIVINVDSKTYTISKDDKRFNVVKNLIKTDCTEVLKHVVEPDANYYKLVKRLKESK